MIVSFVNPYSSIGYGSDVICFDEDNLSKGGKWYSLPLVSFKTLLLRPYAITSIVKKDNGYVIFFTGKKAYEISAIQGNMCRVEIFKDGRDETFPTPPVFVNGYVNCTHTDVPQ